MTIDQSRDYQTLRGRIHVYLVDDIDTDRIIPGKYTKTLDLSQLAAHCLEDLDPAFSARVRPGDILVAGDNFGCGSSREQAPLALKAAGVAAVIARGYARIFYRNAINIGLPALEVADFPADAFQKGDELAVDLHHGMVHNVRTGAFFAATRMPQVMVDILAAGGLVPYLARHGDYPDEIE